MNPNSILEHILDQHRRAEPWMQHALCVGQNPALWFPERGAPTEPGKRICRQCPSRQPCLDYALRRNERHGIWGAMSTDERRRLTADGIPA